MREVMYKRYSIQYVYKCMYKTGDAHCRNVYAGLTAGPSGHLLVEGGAINARPMSLSPFSSVWVCVWHRCMSISVLPTVFDC